MARRLVRIQILTIRHDPKKMGSSIWTVLGAAVRGEERASGLKIVVLDDDRGSGLASYVPCPHQNNHAGFLSME